MQPIQNQYLNILTKFNSQLNYLKIDENDKPILCNKSDLSWIQSISRWFWKPENERITQITRKIFAHLGEDIFQQLHGNSHYLTRVFEHLGYLSNRADRKMGYSAYNSQAFALQNVNFGKLAVQNEVNRIQVAFQKSKEQLDKIKSENEHTLQELELSYAKQHSDLQNQIDEAKGFLSALKIENEHLNEECALSKVKISKLSQNEHEIAQNVKALSNIHTETTQQVKALEFQKLYLQSDTVLWTEDGYALCHSSFFAPESVLNCLQFNTMCKLSPQVADRLDILKNSEKEKSELLQSLPKHLYLENAKIQHVKMLLTALELGPAAIYEYSNDAYAGVCALADYLQQPKLDAETTTIKKMREKIQLQRIYRKEREMSHLQALNTVKNLSEKIEKLENKHQNLKKVASLVKQLKRSITKDILEDHALDDAFRKTLKQLYHVSV